MGTSCLPTAYPYSWGKCAQDATAQTVAGLTRSERTPDPPAWARLGLPASDAETPDASTLGLSANTSQSVDDAFNAIVYRAQVQEMTLAMQLQQVRARITEQAGDGGNRVQVQAQQMNFDFFAQVRAEEMVLFQERTGAVSDDLSGVRRQRFYAAQQQLEVRFELSASMSGVALSGFANAAEGLAEGDGTQFDKFLGLSESLFEQTDEVLQRIFDLLDGFFKGGDDFENAFDALLRQIYDVLGSFEGFGAANENAGASQTVTSYQLEFEFSFSAKIQVTQAEVQESDPITFDLDGDGIELSHYSQGARFDILGSGQRATTAFVTGGDAFLAVDRNGNSKIDSGKELFGDQNGAANGFEELRAFDTNGDNRINAQDADFDKLLLFKDDGDGVTEPGELIRLADAGIVEIALDYRNVDQRAAGANRIAQTASYRRADGSRGFAADVILNFTV